MLPTIKHTYRAIATGVSFGVSSNGNYQIGVTMTVQDDTEFGGEQITWIGHFTEKTQDRSIESLQHMGWKGDEIDELADLDAEGCQRLLPDVVEIACDAEEYNGELQLKVKWVNKPGAGRFAFKEQLAGAALKSFAAQMKNAVRGAKAASGAPPRKATSSNGGSKAVHPNAPGGSYGDEPPF